MVSGVKAVLGLPYGFELHDALDALGLASARTVLDVGVGAGDASVPFARRGAAVTAIDPDPGALAAARTALPGASVVSGRAEALPFPDRAFDAVLAAQVLHLVDAPAALAEMTRVVRPGGRIAAWWRELAADEPLRGVRAAAAEAAGAPPRPDDLGGGFRAFYGAPLAARELRVVPSISRVTVAHWLELERGDAVSSAHYGRAHRAYVDALTAALAAAAGTGGTIGVRFTHYVYVGTVG